MKEAVERGVACAPSPGPISAASLRAAGAEPVRGNAQEPTWMEEARGADILVDLVQPTLPSRMSRRAIRRVRDERLSRDSRPSSPRSSTFRRASVPSTSRPPAPTTSSPTRPARSATSPHALRRRGLRDDRGPGEEAPGALRASSPRSSTSGSWSMGRQGLRRRLRGGHAQGARRGDRIGEEQAAAHARDRCGAARSCTSPACLAATWPGAGSWPPTAPTSRRVSCSTRRPTSWA